MLKTLLSFLIVLGVAFGAGGASLWYALAAQEGVGAVTIAGWSAFPDAGTPQADPYAKARVARLGVLTLGRSEGLAFTAERDSAGAPLLRQCDYTIEGTVPTARFWTIFAADPAGAVIPTDKPRPAALQSNQLLRQPDGSVTISASAAPAPGNWLALTGAGEMRFVLSLYDTPVASSTGLTGLEMPRIVQVGCHA